MQHVEIGQKVVRSKGDYVVGRIGEVVEIDNEKKRARVYWLSENLRTWVKFDVIEDINVPYIITHTGRFPKYERRLLQACRGLARVQNHRPIPNHSGLETGRLHGGEPENGHSYLRQDVG